MYFFSLSGRYPREERNCAVLKKPKNLEKRKRNVKGKERNKEENRKINTDVEWKEYHIKKLQKKLIRNCFLFLVKCLSSIQCVEKKRLKAKGYH